MKVKGVGSFVLMTLVVILLYLFVNDGVLSWKVLAGTLILQTLVVWLYVDALHDEIVYWRDRYDTCFGENEFTKGLLEKARAELRKLQQ